MPELPQALGPGHLLELYRAQYNTSTSSHVVEEVEGDLMLLQVSPELMPELLSYPFATPTLAPGEARGGRRR